MNIADVRPLFVFLLSLAICLVFARLVRNER
jgi:hypothetical protein